MSHHNRIFISNSTVHSYKNSSTGAQSTDDAKCSIAAAMHKNGVTNNEIVKLVSVILLIGAGSAIFVVYKVPFLQEKIGHEQPLSSPSPAPAPVPSSEPSKSALPSPSPAPAPVPSSEPSNSVTTSVVPTTNDKLVDFCANLAAGVANGAMDVKIKCEAGHI